MADRIRQTIVAIIETSVATDEREVSDCLRKHLRVHPVSVTIKPTLLDKP